jgi:DNA polymerase I-like protein with 3'-5' exonuclease and polymerase domains
MSETEDFDEMLAALEAVQPPAETRSTAVPDTDPVNSYPDPTGEPIEPDGPVAAPPPMAAPVTAPVATDDAEDFMSGMGLQAEGQQDLRKPWMKHHRFVLVQKIEEVRKLIDEAIASGKCSLDLECEGLDNRIIYNAQGKMETVHKIVGYCIAYGDAKAGYYIPVRHKPFDGSPGMNVEPVAEVEAEIRRLCLAAQPTPKPGQEDLLAFKEFETPPRVVIDFWNAKFDQEFLFPVTGIDFWHPDSFEDGLLAFFTIFSGDHALGLKPKAAQKLRDPDGNPYVMIEIKDLFPNRRKINFASLSPDEPNVVPYACSDAICTRLLCALPDLLPVIRADKRGRAFTYRLEKQVSQVVRVMERNRVRVNRQRVIELRDIHRKGRERYREMIVALARSKGFMEFEPGSPAQLSEFLFSERGLNINPKPEKNASGAYKTDFDTLDGITKELGDNAPEVLKWVVSYREEDKVLGTYLESLSTNPDANDELRFNFKQTGAATGRFSAPAGEPEHGFSGVPIHGMPSTSDLRQVFEARIGYTMVKCDYAGQELRIVTNLSNEPVWVKEFLEGTGDLHTITARAFYNKQEVSKDERKAGKVANFALVYGGGPQAIMRATGCDKVEGQRRKQAFDKAVPTFAKWVKGQHDKVKKDLGVYTAFGRWVSIPDASIRVGQLDQNGKPVGSDEDIRRIRAACERHATNYPIQGCLQPSARVLTTQGYKTVAQLREEGGTGWTWTGSNWAEFEILDKGEWQYAEIELVDGTIIPCDTRHKLLVVTESGYEWREYEALRPEDQVATSLATPVQFPGEPLPPLEVGEKSNLSPLLPEGCEADLWFWLGYYYGDGWKGDEKGCLTYCFGDHETSMMDRCVGFWSHWGLNPKIKENTHQPAEKVSTRFDVEVRSVDLARWLSKLGINQSDAHTKRLPDRVFCEPLLYRQAFIKGLMASDGHRTSDGNPYHLHLYQADLLRDVKLLLRTVGVESSLHGPYHQTDKNGLETTSYRLDINQRMFRVAVDGTAARMPKFHDQRTPPFLVRALIEKYPHEKPSSFPTKTLYNLYLRMKAGGATTLNMFQHMLDTMGYRIDQPVYGYKRLKAKRELSTKGPTYTLSVNDPRHRFEAEGVITKNSGADIMKIAMVLLHKDFYRRGWLKNWTGGNPEQQDIVRMLLSVHDELVFEIRHDQVIHATPVIVDKMELPTRMALPPFSPQWRVPLVTEPLVGPTWGTGYPCERAKADHKLKEGEVIHNGFLYGTIRTVDLGKEDPGAGEVEHWRDEKSKKLKIRFLEPQWLLQAGGSLPEPIREAPPPATPPATPPPGAPAAAPAAPVAASPAPSTPSIPPPTSAAPAAPEQVVVIRLTLLNGRTVRQVMGIVTSNADPKGKLLHLTDATGTTLIDPQQHRLRIDAEKVAKALQELHISDGRIGVVV